MPSIDTPLAPPDQTGTPSQRRLAMWVLTAAGMALASFIPALAVIITAAGWCVAPTSARRRRIALALLVAALAVALVFPPIGPVGAVVAWAILRERKTAQARIAGPVLALVVVGLGNALGQPILVFVAAAAVGAWASAFLDRPRRAQTAGEVALVTGAAAWTLVKVVAGIAGLALIVAGFVLDHNETFKTECGLHKEFGTSIGAVKNVICDADFTIN